MYGFIKNYITSTKWIETNAQARNSKVKPDGAGDLKLILDGQQRLSSFYIGLKGTYTYKVCVDPFALLLKLEPGIPTHFTGIGVCNANKRPAIERDVLCHKLFHHL